MRFLIAAISVVLLFVTAGSRANEGDFELEKIKTIYGRIYRDILILGADRHGLTFRHREGIAKVEFAALSGNVQLLYKVTGEIPATGEVESGQATVPAGATSTTPAGAENHVLTIYHRLTLYAPPIEDRFIYRPCQEAIYWPSSWPQYHPAHQLTIPYYRERSVRDFLILSGLSGAGSVFP
ncbi:MAG: hypothetical protein ABL994_19480 [Verrucomicrobiales bacterium]